MVEVFAIRTLPSGIFVQARELILSKLPVNRRETVTRYRHEADQQRSLLAEALLHFIIHKKTDLNPRDYTILDNGKGKPIFSDHRYNIHFNISHSGDWSVCAIGKKETGIDIERTRTLDPTMAGRMLCSNEQLLYHKLDEHDKQRFLIRTWTLKESYLKAVGSGLSVPMNSFSMVYDKNKIGLMVNNRLSNQYQFRILHLDDGYHMAVCSRDSKFRKKVIFPGPDCILDFWERLI